MLYKFFFADKFKYVDLEINVMILNKRGDFRITSWRWLLLGLLFLAIGLMPFFPNLFPITFELTSLILKLLISVIGLLLIIEAYGGRYDSGGWFRVFLSLIPFGAGIWMTLMQFAIIPVLFEINIIILQIMVIIYSVFVLIGAWLQE